MKNGIECLERRVLLATFVVTTTADAGAGSLRQAMLSANATPGLDTINFDVAPGGQQTINVLSELPEVNDPVIIDGSTQPGFAGNPIIELNGQAAGGGTNGLRIRSGGSTIRSLVINRFGSDGITISSNGNNTIVNNFIGTDVTGTLARPNSDSGIDIGDDVNTISGNLISGNIGAGILIEDDNNVSGNIITANRIGTDVTGTLPIPNAGPGVRFINGLNNRVGGPNAGDGNTIAFNNGDGVEVQSGANNAVVGNSIFQNQGLGIDLLPNGVTPNDLGDGDVGANELQNFPVLNAATVGAAQITITGTLNSNANQTFRVEFFASPNADPSGNGEGRTFLGSTTVTTDAAGNASFNVMLPAPPAGSNVISSTATEAGNFGSTSEFSANVTATPAEPAPRVTSSEFRFSGATLPDAPHRLVYQFDANVGASLGTEDLILNNDTTGTQVPPASIALSYDAATNTATFTFPGVPDGVLPDGRYTARLVAAGVTGPGGQPLDGDGDGTPGGDHLQQFFFLTADFDHNAIVNLQDFNILAANFGQANRSFAQGDANYDGTVNLADFNLLAGKFGATVAPAATTATAATTAVRLGSTDSAGEAHDDDDHARSPFSDILV